MLSETRDKLRSTDSDQLEEQRSIVPEECEEERSVDSVKHKELSSVDPELQEKPRTVVSETHDEPLPADAKQQDELQRSVVSNQLFDQSHEVQRPVDSEHQDVLSPDNQQKPKGYDSEHDIVAKAGPESVIVTHQIPAESITSDHEYLSDDEDDELPGWNKLFLRLSTCESIVNLQPKKTLEIWLSLCNLDKSGINANKKIRLIDHLKTVSLSPDLMLPKKFIISIINKMQDNLKIDELHHLGLSAEGSALERKERLKKHMLFVANVPLDNNVDNNVTLADMKTIPLSGNYKSILGSQHTKNVTEPLVPDLLENEANDIGSSEVDSASSISSCEDETYDSESPLKASLQPSNIVKVINAQNNSTLNCWLKILNISKNCKTSTQKISELTARIKDKSLPELPNSFISKIIAKMNDDLVSSELSDRGLPTSGDAPAMKRRLYEALNLSSVHSSPNPPKVTTSTTIPITPVTNVRSPPPLGSAHDNKPQRKLIGNSDDSSHIALETLQEAMLKMKQGFESELKRQDACINLLLNNDAWVKSSKKLNVSNSTNPESKHLSAQLNKLQSRLTNEENRSGAMEDEIKHNKASLVLSERRNMQLEHEIVQLKSVQVLNMKRVEDLETQLNFSLSNFNKRVEALENIKKQSVPNHSVDPDKLKQVLTGTEPVNSPGLRLNNMEVKNLTMLSALNMYSMSPAGCLNTPSTSNSGTNRWKVPDPTATLGSFSR